MGARILKVGVSVLLLAVVIFVVATPVGPVPGFLLGGTETEVPAAWGDTRSIDEIRFEVSSGLLPRVVIIWVVQFEGDLYVVGDGKSGWVGMLDQGGSVRMRIGDKTYSLNAQRVKNNLVPILEAYQGKYRADYPEIVNSFPQAMESVKSAGVFRLSTKSEKFGQSDPSDVR